MIITITTTIQGRIVDLELIIVTRLTPTISMT